jgi:hypothetical protein
MILLSIRVEAAFTFPLKHNGNTPIDGEGVFLSTDNGKSWTAVNDGFSDNPDMHSLAVCGDYLVAGSSGGQIWRRPLSEMIEKVRTLPQQEKHNKSQVQISPVSRTGYDIPIIFTHPCAKRAAVAVFDINGRTVFFIVNSNLATGSFRFVWNTRGLAQGNYFIRLQTGARTWTKRVQIVH